MTYKQIKSGEIEALALKHERLLRSSEVQRLTNIGKTKRNELMREGQFPTPIKACGGRTNFWLASEVEQWIRNQAFAHRRQVSKIVNDPANAFLYQAVGSSRPGSVAKESGNA